MYLTDCGQPTEEEMANGNFVGDTTHGGTAALLCSTGYEGGGQAYCNDGTWTIPACNAKGKHDNKMQYYPLFQFYFSTCSKSCVKRPLKN